MMEPEERYVTSSYGLPVRSRKSLWFSISLAILLAIIAIILILLVNARPIGDVKSQVVGIRLEGTKLQLEGLSNELDLGPLIRDIVAQSLDSREAPPQAETPPPAVTNVYNTFLSKGTTGTDSQTLSLSGNVLTISGGNSVNLPSASAEGDGEVGNEVTDVVASAGLLRVGAGTTLDPYKIGLDICANGEILKSSGGGAWACGADAGGSSYTAGNGLQLIGAQFSVNSPTCAGTAKLQWNGTAFVCSADVDTDTNTTYSAGTGLNLVGTTFNNTGTLSVAGSGAVTSTGGQNPTIAFANGSSAGQFWQWDGNSWELATASGEVDGIIGNEVTNVTGGNSGLVRSGAGTAVDPYTLAASVGNGIQLVGGAIAINSPTCAGTTKLQWNGTAFVCSADVDTDTNTTYSAGTGLSLVGTTFNNTGTLSVAGAGAVTSTGGQNPTIAFANGSVVGQFWQWDGDSWELATGSGETDGIIGNEVTNVTGANSGLVRSGAGTAVDPYTLAASVGNGIQLVGGAIAINSPTCAGTTKLQWNGTAFVCSADVDTDTNTTYSSGNGLQLVGTTFSVNSPTCAGTDKLQWNGTAFVCATDQTGAGTCSAAGTFACDGGNTLGSSLDLGTTDAQSLNLITSGATGLTINSTGRVGIGETSQQAALHVTNATAALDLFRVTDGTATAVDVFKIADEGAITQKTRTNSATAFQVLNATDVPVFVVDTVNNAVKIGGGDISANATPGLLVLDHKNTSGDPTGVDGAMYYNASMGGFRCYEQSAWKFCNEQRSQQSGYRLDEDFWSNNDSAPTIGTHGWDEDFSGTGVSDVYAGSEDKHPGIRIMGTGSTATGRIVVTLGDKTGDANPYTNLVVGGGEVIEAGVKFPVLYSAAQTYAFRVGLGDSATGEFTDGIYFEYDGATSTTWRMGTANSGTRTEITNTNAACAAGGSAVTVGASTWYNLRAVVNSAGTQADFYINGTFVGCTASNVPSGTADKVNPIFQLIKTGTGITNREAYIDYFSVYSNFTSLR